MDHLRALVLGLAALAIATPAVASPGARSRTRIKPARQARKVQLRSRPAANRVLAKRAAGLQRLRLRQRIGSGGKLRPGVHRYTLAQLSTQFGRSPQRSRALASLKKMLAAFERAGIQKVYLGGSFVSAKKTPGDVDVLVSDSGSANWNAVIEAARGAHGAGIRVYVAEGRVADVNQRKLTPRQRRAWSKKEPSYLEFFQQDRSGRAVGVAEIALRPVGSDSRSTDRGRTSKQTEEWRNKYLGGDLGKPPMSPAGSYSAGGIGSLP